ncbi:hypothetical protein D3C76_27570 [compost metagenome]
MDYAGVVAAFLMASSCDNTLGCREIVVAPFHGPSGSELCQIAAQHFNQENAFKKVTGNNRPIVFVCKPPPQVASSGPRTNM